MKRLPSLIASLAAALALSAAAHAQEVKGVDGDWTGKLEAGGAELNLIFHIKTTGGKTVVTIDSLDQGAMGIPVTGIKRDGQKVSMDVQAVQPCRARTRRRSPQTASRCPEPGRNSAIHCRWS
jgi:hypothetical protein